MKSETLPMLFVDDMAEVDRLILEPLEAGCRISISGFLDLLTLVREATPGRGRDVSFLANGRGTGRRGKSRTFDLEHVTPLEVIDKVGGQGLHALGQAFSGRHAAAWAFRKRVAPGRWDVCEAGPVDGRIFMHAWVHDERDGNDTFSMCSPLMAHSTLAYIWAGVREFQLELQGESHG